MDKENSENRVADLEQKLFLLVEANHHLNQKLSLPIICKTLVEYGMKLVNATAGSAGMLEDGQMHFKNYYREDSSQIINLSFKPGEGVPGWVTQNLIPYISHDALNDPEVIPEIQQVLGFITLITIPIIDNHGLLIGCMELHNKRDNAQFDQQDIDLLEGLAASAAIAIKNAKAVEQQQKMQDALQRSEDRFVRSLRFANIGTWDWNIETGDLYWSEQIAPLFGYASGELETTYDNFLAAVHEEDRQSVIDAVNASVEQDADYNIEHRVVWPDGTIRWVLERGGVEKSSAGKPLHMLGVVQDITQRVELDQALRQQRNFAEGMIDTAQTIVLVLDTDGIIIRFNPYLETISGYGMEEIIGRDWFETFLPKADQDSMRQLFKGAIGNIQTKGNINPIITKSGELCQIEWYDKTLRDSNGEIVGLLAIGQDITDRIKAEEERRLASMVLENTPEGVMITDPDLRVISINPAFTRTTGYNADEMVGERPTKLSSGRHDNAFYKAMWHSIAETDRWQGEIWNRRKDGEIYPEWLNINAIKDESGNITHYASIFSDISTQEHVRKRLHNLAYYDALTKLPNRELFHDRLENALIQSRRRNRHVGLMFLDMDRFKNINDTLGHRVGDEFLKLTADRLQECVRDMDTVSRLGGDEFTIILPDISSSNDVAVVAEKIVSSFTSPITLEDGHELFSSASIGISLYPEDGDNADLLLKNADTAMYRAKDAGRGSYQFYSSEMSSNFAERLLIETELRRAIENEQLTLAYQPQIDITTGRIIGFEALTRWDHPEHGPISPAVFIPIAEDSGQIEKLGEWVLRESCQQLNQWRAQYGDNWRMAVNFSGLQLRKPDVVQCISNALKQVDVSSDMLELELTESSLMDSAESNISTIEKLSVLGFQMAIDDFGTGYSSLSYLKRFKIDKLKIDQSFVRDITSDRDDAEIVTTIIAMAHNLGLRVIAEGVETQEQLDFLRARGCDEVQGYYISRPKSAADIETMVANRELNFS